MPEIKNTLYIAGSLVYWYLWGYVQQFVILLIIEIAILLLVTDPQEMITKVSKIQILSK